MLKAFVAFVLRLSVICAVKLDVPTVVGVPVSAPPLLKLKPLGNVPAEMLQV